MVDNDLISESAIECNWMIGCRKTSSKRYLQQSAQIKVTKTIIDGIILDFYANNSIPIVLMLILIINNTSEV